MKQVKRAVKNIPVAGPLAKGVVKSARKFARMRAFTGSREYWESRYAVGFTSGYGSVGPLAEFKAEFLNSFVNEHNVGTLIEFGCGDGSQLLLATYPSYIGLDVSKTAIKLCKERFKDDLSKSFFLYDSEYFVDRHAVFTADVALSLDVIYHITEDSVFELYIRQLFSAAEKFVIVYSNDTDDNRVFAEPHVKYRRFTEWVAQNISGWKLLQRIPNKYPYNENDKTGSIADFFVYGRS